MDESFVILGRVSGLHGVRGWVRVFSETRERDAILKFDPWYVRVGDRWQPFRPREGRVQGKGVVVASLEGIDDRDQASKLIGADIAVQRAQLPRAGRGEYYWFDLEGLQVTNLEGIVLGTVSHLFETGANDVVVVTDGERERLIPFTRQAVKEVDLESRTMKVDWDPEF